jgi:type I restriction enzyme S subunit
MVSKEEIPQHWDWSDMESEVYIELGNSPPGDSYNEEGDGEPFLQGASRFGEEYPSEGKYTTEPNKFCKEGDVLITIRAGVGELNRADKEYCIGRGIAALRGEKRITNDYLHYYLMSLKPYWEKVSSGSTYSSITKKDIKNAPLPVPPLEEQKAIVDKLDEIFGSIEEIQDAQEQAEELEKNLKISVIGSELEKYENEEKIEDVISRIKGGSSADQHDEPRGYPVSRIETIADAEIDPEAVNYVDIGQKEYEKHVMQEGDILFSNINSPPHVGKTAIYEGVPEDLIHGMNLVLIRADEEKILPEFLELSLTFEKNKGTFKNMCKQAVNQASLAQRDIKPIKITVPPIEDQKEIMQRISSVRGQVRKIFRSHSQAEEVTEDLPKSVLAEVFKGNLVDFGALSESDELGSTDQEIREKQDSSFDGEGQQSLGEYR